MSGPRIHRIMSGEDDSLSAFVTRCAAACIEPFYVAATSLRNGLYSAGLLRSYAAPVPVISVGNLTTGGTGKTPMVIHLARLLQQHGVTPAILMRGYGGAAGQPSDEHQLLLSALHGVPIIAEADRAAAARDLARRHPECTAILLDDGFQHRRLKRDLDLVLVDASNPFGFGRVLPRGMLRESPGGLRRAHGVIITHAEQVSDSDIAHVADRITRYHGKPPLAVFRHHWSSVVDGADRPAELGGSSVFVACAIGNPEAFIEQARAAAHVCGTMLFDDHHRYSQADVRQIVEAARSAGATAVLVTEKDWVKLRPVLESAAEKPNFPFWRPVLSIQCVKGAKELERCLIDAAKAMIAPL